MIGRTIAGVAAALITFWLAVQIQPQEIPVDAPDAVSIPVVAAPLPIACPGSLHIPVGNVGGTEGSIGSGSDDVRESTFTSGIDTPIPTDGGWTSTSALATEIERVGSGDIAGLAAVPCLAPRNDTWLIGGSTALGSSARLVLTNPTGVASDVVVTFYGPAGKVDQDLSVAVGGHSQSTFLLEGVAAGLATLAAHVEATAAGVVALSFRTRGSTGSCLRAPIGSCRTSPMPSISSSRASARAIPRASRGRRPFGCSRPTGRRSRCRSPGRSAPSRGRQGRD